MKKRTILSIIVILFINLFILSSCGNSYSIGLEYKINELNTYSVTGIGTCTDVDIVIPRIHNGIKVEAIENGAFNNSEIESITMPNSITFMGISAFQYCKKLKSVKFSNNLRNINAYGFFGCTSLESIEIPSSVIIISLTAFGECTNLKEVTFKEGSQLTTIFDLAFDNCTSLKNITIPATVTKIFDKSFKKCSSLENVYYNGTIEDWCNIELDGTPMEYAEHFYMLNGNNEYYEVTEIEIPATITKLNQRRFYGFNNITKVIIPSSVKSISGNVFGNCENLTIYCEDKYKPYGWDPDWNPDNCPVVWGYKNN